MKKEYRKTITYDDGMFVLAEVHLYIDGKKIKRCDYKFCFTFFGLVYAFRRAHKWANRMIEICETHEANPEQKFEEYFVPKKGGLI